MMFWEDSRRDGRSPPTGDNASFLDSFPSDSICGHSDGQGWVELNKSEGGGGRVCFVNQILQSPPTRNGRSWNDVDTSYHRRKSFAALNFLFSFLVYQLDNKTSSFIIALQWIYNVNERRKEGEESKVEKMRFRIITSEFVLLISLSWEFSAFPSCFKRIPNWIVQGIFLTFLHYSETDDDDDSWWDDEGVPQQQLFSRSRSKRDVVHL